MEKDEAKTTVIFRKYKNSGDILALFPYLVCTHEGYVDCYEHVGQHGIADYRYCLSITTLANDEEYKELRKELENNFGYNLEIRKRINIEKYLAAYRKY